MTSTFDESNFLENLKASGEGWIPDQGISYPSEISMYKLRQWIKQHTETFTNRTNDKNTRQTAKSTRDHGVQVVDHGVQVVTRKMMEAYKSNAHVRDRFEQYWRKNLEPHFSDKPTEWIDNAEADPGALETAYAASVPERVCALANEDEDGDGVGNLYRYGQWTENASTSSAGSIVIPTGLSSEGARRLLGAVWLNTVFKLKEADEWEDVPEE